MSVKCEICGKQFRTAFARNEHRKFCRILEKFRGKSFIISERKTGDVEYFMHVSKTARCENKFRSKPSTYVNSDEIKMSGIYMMPIYGNQPCYDSVLSLLMLALVMNGKDSNYVGKEATEEDCKSIREKILEQFDRVIIS